PRQRQTAGFVTSTIHPGSEVGVYYLKRNDQIDADMLTLRGIVELFKAYPLDLEYAKGFTGGNKGDAYSVRLNGSQEWIQYDFRFVHADPHYPGYYRDLNYMTANLNLFLGGKFRVETFIRDEERNLRRDTAMFSAPHERFVQVGTGYSNIVSISFRTTRQEDRLSGLQYRRTEQVGQVRLGYPGSSFDVYANADLGSIRDKLQNRSFPFRRYALYSGVRPTASQSYNISLEFTEDQNFLTGEKQKRYGAGLTASLQLSSATQMQVSGYANRSTGAFAQRYSLLEVHMSHVFPFQHRIAVRGRRNVITPSISTGETAFALEYTIPVAIPVKRLTTTGQVRGRLVDERGNGIPNILVSVGRQATISDRKGDFVLGALQPGTQFLIVDKAGIGLDRVTLQPMPMEIAVSGGEESRTTISVVRSSTVSGSIVQYDFVENNLTDTVARAMEEVGGLSGLIVELSNGVEVQRRASDNRGRFLFADLRPGVWTLRLDGGEFPPYHYAEKDTFSLTVEPGTSKEATFRLLPRKRTIQILSEGTVVQEEQQPSSPVLTTQRSPASLNVEPCMISYRPEKSGYVLQVSSWTRDQKAAEEARRVEKLSGYPTFVEQTNVSGLGTHFRVFLGSFKTREEAETVCKRLQEAKP
ncbi:MAG: SPOR domain-containing protein, partial [Bacteroidota bacterium]